MHAPCRALLDLGSRLHGASDRAQVPAALRTDGLERWWIESEDGDVEAWFLPGRGAGADHPGPAVIFAHGNGELIDHWPSMLARHRELGVSVILPDYRGYGRSAGAPSEDAIRADLRSLYARVETHPAIDEDRLAYHGRSLGGGAVMTLVGAHAPRALILSRRSRASPMSRRGCTSRPSSRGVSTVVST